MSVADRVHTGTVSDESEETTQHADEQSSMDEQGDSQLPMLNEGKEIMHHEHKISSPKTKDEHANSEVYTATSLSLKTKDKSVKSQPLILDWAFGINQALPVFSLLDQDRLVMLYGCANVAVIHDHASNSQRLLQGHCSPISSLCVSEDRRWLVTADKGQESLVIVWDSFTGIPVLTLFDCHPEGGVVALALSKDSKYLATVGAGRVQRVCIWDWTNEGEGPTCQTDISPEHGCQNHILFNPTDSSQLLSNSKSHVLFYTWDKKIMEYTAPELSDKTFSKVVGSLSQSAFHFAGLQAFSVTLAGNLVLWESLRDTSTCQPNAMKATKLIPLQKDGITTLTMCDSLIVTGDMRGRVKFYDGNFKLITWCSEFNLDPIASISFSKDIPFNNSLEQQEDCTVNAKQFVIRNFVISTVSATVVHVTRRGSVAQTLLREHEGPLHTVACHPKQPLVAMGSHSGILKVWDYEQKVVISSRDFHPDKQIQCITYDPQGFYLAVGFVSGAVKILDTYTLQQEEQESIQYSQDCITHLTFSHDSTLLATADTGKAVMVFHLCKEGGGLSWKYLGKHRSHYKPIQDLLFGVDLDSRQPRLLSLGIDRRLVEYDLQKSKKDELLILSSERIEQSAVPMCMAWYPPLSTEHFLLTASNHYKMKLFNVTTKMCRKTVLGPTYGSPMKRMLILPPSKDGDLNSYYMAYITQDKVGLQILPLDGNPYKSSAMICHSMGVSSLACSYDGRYVFTAGGVDKTVFSWEISLSALEAAAALGGKDLVPFYSLLEGGRDGELVRAMEDFFYYCQLRNQGIDSMETRRVSTQIPLTEVPFVMRALGFYPTEQELEDMQNEVKFSRYAETGNHVTDVDLEEFIKLFVNHRPAFGTSSEELCSAFQVLGAVVENGRPVITREELLELLQARGEHMTEEELGECFMTLLGFNVEGGRSEARISQCKETDKLLLESELPPDITADTFATDILGFHVATQELPPEQDSSSSITCKDSFEQM
ncbi:cilia- and flagella-associated protein 251 [Electrophorus electricus]|uniref:cilia- and flagella-associated protein 251 n=1 Tax=Electrophorus electricus TaxID=8005 RepID=UPI0015D08C2C|nr:cilia- and flagella-associated protein 251 [Electrophorus electricus]